MVGRVRAELERGGHGAAVAVVDSHGELIALLRTDNCRLSCIQVAINKASTAAREGAPSKELGVASKREGFPVTYFGSLKYVGWGGGIPIVENGSVAGAVGVSGLSEEEDMALAQLAVDSLAE
jgi:glc operon protein GlcG